jgi:hypothetical protein
MAAWKDSRRRYLHTGIGTIIVDPGETAIVIVGRDFDAALLKALGIEMIATHEESK